MPSVEIYCVREGTVIEFNPLRHASTAGCQHNFTDGDLGLAVELANSILDCFVIVSGSAAVADTVFGTAVIAESGVFGFFPGVFLIAVSAFVANPDISGIQGHGARVGEVVTGDIND